MAEPRYVPAAGLHALTRLYDPINALFSREPRWRPVLMRAVLEDGPQTIVDVGAGTGALAIPLAAHAEVIAIDGDPDALAIARAKPAGRLHVADWGRPSGLIPSAGFALLKRLDGIDNVRALGEGRLPQILRTAGFADVRTHLCLGTTFGTLELHRAMR